MNPDGDDLGSIMSARPDWSPGDEIPMRPGEHLRVLELIDLDGDEDDVIAAILKVEPVDLS
jgi:hypothetical protein